MEREPAPATHRYCRHHIRADYPVLNAFSEAGAVSECFSHEGVLLGEVVFWALDGSIRDIERITCLGRVLRYSL